MVQSFKMYLSTKPSYNLNWCIGFHHKIYTNLHPKKKFTKNLHNLHNWIMVRLY
jgi:hypothetical protein